MANNEENNETEADIAAASEEQVKSGVDEPKARSGKASPTANLANAHTVRVGSVG